MMPAYIEYVPHTFSRANRELIATCNALIDEYRAQGFTLTLRQLYYQYVSRGVIANTHHEYKRLGSIINDARLAGLVDWTAITDRTRALRSAAHWDSPRDIVRGAASQFRIDKWRGQAVYPEVWIEKDALAGVIEGVCTQLDVPYFSCRGYTSSSEMWGAAQRLLDHQRAGQAPLILHLGDHDPSGKDMTRDVADRLALFMGADVQVERLALNRDQIDHYGPPPNPAKLTDARADAYIAEFGLSSWELDALEPRVIAGLIERAILQVRDEPAWADAVAEEATHRRHLTAVADAWERIAATTELEGAGGTA